MAQQYIGTARWGTVTNQNYTGTANTPITVGSGVYKVRLLVTTDAYVRTDSTTSTSSIGAYMPALTPEYVTVTPGQTITAVQVTTGGSLQVTECL
jgi:hypothetical protein